MVVMISLVTMIVSWQLLIGQMLLYYKLLSNNKLSTFQGLCLHCKVIYLTMT